jgi:hypothetical protein
MSRELPTGTPRLCTCRSRTPCAHAIVRQRAATVCRRLAAAAARDALAERLVPGVARVAQVFPRATDRPGSPAPRARFISTVAYGTLPSSQTKWRHREPSWVRLLRNGRFLGARRARKEDGARRPDSGLRKPRSPKPGERGRNADYLRRESAYASARVVLLGARVLHAVAHGRIKVLADRAQDPVYRPRFAVGHALARFWIPVVTDSAKDLVNAVRQALAPLRVPVTVHAHGQRAARRFGVLRPRGRATSGYGKSGNGSTKQLHERLHCFILLRLHAELAAPSIARATDPAGVRLGGAHVKCAPLGR